jgi:dTDP-4-dehydrorhamnose reductase
MTARLLVLGTTGMLGHTLMRELGGVEDLEVCGSARDVGPLRGAFSDRLLEQVVPGVDASDMDCVRRLLKDVQPDVVVNCVGLVKQSPRVDDAVDTITLNALLPRLLARECADSGIRLIHVSTDCVFSGDRGNYVETDIPDPRDLYGRSKLLGEVTAAPALTVRTSIIGHELQSRRSLVDWFLSQTGEVKGYTRATYSGVTTAEFARLLRSVVLPRPDLTGLLHVASAPISKYELLRLIAREYGWAGRLVAFDGFVCDRSLSADALFRRTGYRPPPWPEMIAEMRRSALPSRSGDPTARGGR